LEEEDEETGVGGSNVDDLRIPSTASSLSDTCLVPEVFGASIILAAFSVVGVPTAR
jgi:hypothetical protein